MMNYIVVILLSLLAGSFINIVCNFDSLGQNLFKNLIVNTYKNIRYLAVIIITAFSYMLIFIKYETYYEMLVSYVLLLILLIGAIYDIKSGFISNKLILSGLISGIVLKAIRFDLDFFIGAIIFCFAVWLILFMISFFSKGNFGMGDVKLLAVFALYMDVMTTITVFMISLLLTVVYGLFLLAFKKTGLKHKIPYAPFLTAGFIIYTFFSL